MIYQADAIKAIIVTSATSNLFVKRRKKWYTVCHRKLIKVPDMSNEALDDLYNDLKGERNG